MTRLPSLTGEQVIKALGKTGFQVLRQKGSHIYLKHPDGRATVVPVHKGESVGRGILRKIMQDADLSREEFMKLL
ncbi:MAG TPA: type II toxin-antitoxin system HicA family toxin [Dehalococcoidia bacterium]|nr:type II toxin-antitoxin system HicA family toxin [Dehalococcoidia bacterium]